jgi:hypothetical protein
MKTDPHIYQSVLFTQTQKEFEVNAALKLVSQSAPGRPINVTLKTEVSSALTHGPKAGFKSVFAIDHFLDAILKM